MRQPGVLEVAVLGLLKDRAMHGYELRKQLGAMLGPFWQVSWGSLYPTLRRLARAGTVEKAAKTSGRRKNVYRITPRGEETFKALLKESGAPIDADNFTLKLAFFRYLDPEARLQLLQRRRAYLQDKLAQFKANLRDYKEKMDSYALSLQDHSINATESDIAWIDELITRERAPRARARKA